VFEIKKTAAAYASAPTTLINFNGDNGANPVASLIADANGDLFGTTEFGGASGEGTVFEVTGSRFVTAGSSAARAIDAILLEHRWTGRDLGNGRNPCDSRRDGEPQSRAELERDRNGRLQ
jgi:uncharacterized repeat protein (TIGR03803 family)